MVQNNATSPRNVAPLMLCFLMGLYITYGLAVRSFELAALDMPAFES